MDPQGDENFFAGQVVILDFENALEDFAEISEIEGVVGLGWGGEELGSDLSVDLHR